MIFNAYSEQKEKVAGMQFVSCGHIFAKPGREINRPSGREDWLLFYIVKESETFYLDSIATGVSGSFIMFAPKEKQHHIYTGNKTAEFYYVHFKCDNLPNDISIKTSKVYDLPLNRKICDIFEDMIDETLQKQPFYEKLCIYKLVGLLTELERSILCENYPDKENFKRISQVIQHMNKFYNSNFTLDDYAEMCALSKFHFLRIFEKIVGITPMEYRNNIRLQHAAELIIDNRLSVEKISNIVGYSSASYFSSAFKQKYGVSPKQYQKSQIG